MLCQRRRLLTFLFTFFIYNKTTKSQIPIGSRLSIIDNNYWISPNGNFALGFFNHSEPYQYSVGIRFNSKSIPIDNQAVVWVAGANLVVGEKSYFEFRESGEFVLFDSVPGSIAWASSNVVITNSTKPSPASAALLDNGNLVIVSNGYEIVWQSFNDPSNTLLPGQNLSVSNILRAASGNLLSSYYSLRLDDFDSGKLQLRWKRNTVYWENFDSGSDSDSIVTRAILDSDGRFQVLDEKSRVVWSVYASDHNDSSIEFRFLRLDIDGNLRLYSWVNAEKRWRSVWSAVNNQCDVFATCELNEICSFNSSLIGSSPVCKCLFTSEKIGSKCLDCRYGSMTTMYKHTTLYGVYPPNETIILANENQCEELCNKDVHCTAATFVNDGNPRCRLLKTQYVSGKSDPSLNSVSFVKKCKNYPLAVKPETTMTSWSSISRDVYIGYLIGLPSCVLVLLVSVQIGIAFFIWKRNNRLITMITKQAGAKGLTIFTYSEIKEITENFKHQIGPRMFKGKLPSKKLVAVKDVRSGNIEERKFRTLMLRIGNIHHKSLVKVEGCCYELGQRFVVYEYAKNGSLKDSMDDVKLTWRKRIEICLAIAKAVSYLHSGCREFICHGNLKIENVVLDENFEAKVSEFGVQSVVPETDVEDFGGILLTVISGRRDFSAVDGGSLATWAYEKWAAERAEEIVARRMIGEGEGGIDMAELERLLRIAFWCLQDDQRFRSSMSEVVKVLEGNLAVDSPPPLTFQVS